MEDLLRASSFFWIELEIIKIELEFTVTNL